MSTLDFIIDLFCRVDAVMLHAPKHPQAKLYPSEIVTLALLFALKGVGPRRFYRWLLRDYRSLFPNLPHRTRLFRLFATHADWSEAFLAHPTVLGVADSYGIELRHPWREDRADQQIGGKTVSNHRWIVGAKLVYVVNQWGLVVGWDYASANVPDNAFHGLIRDFQDDMVIFTDTGFHAKAGDPPNMKPCKRGTWNGRMVIETVLSMLTTVCQFKKLSHRTWTGLQVRLAFTMAVFNLLVQWDGLPVDEDGNIRLSIAEFAL
jgi:hypothetical protein